MLHCSCQSEQPSPVGKGQVKVIVESGDGVNRLKKSPPPTGGIEVVPYHQPPVPAYTQAPVPMVTMANGAGQSTSVPAKVSLCSGSLISSDMLL